jgi:hypothetical protein
MSSTVLVIAIVVIIVVAVAAGLYYMRENRRRQLRERFGPEYDRAVAESGDPGRAEKQLQERVRKHKELEIRDLDPEARNRYAESWRVIQARFVDDPRSALREADILVTTVMGERGYPTEGFEQQADVVSVDHAGTIGTPTASPSPTRGDARAPMTCARRWSTIGHSSTNCWASPLPRAPLERRLGRWNGTTSTRERILSRNRPRVSRA